MSPCFSSSPAVVTIAELGDGGRFFGDATVAVGLARRVTIAAVEGVAHHMQFANVQKMKVSKLKRFMARETFEDEMELHRVDCSSSNGILENHIFLREKQVEFANEPLIPPRLLTGHDLIERGCQPGPAMGEILTKAQDLQLEGQLKSRDEAIEWLNDYLTTPS